MTAVGGTPGVRCPTPGRCFRGAPLLLRLLALAALAAVVIAEVVGGPKEEEQAFRQVVARQVARFPRMQPQDLYKLVFQAALGSRHAGLDSAMAREWLDQEVAGLQPWSDEAVLDTISADGRMVRVNLRPYLAAGGSRDALLRAFIGTARDFLGSEAALRRDLDLAERMADARLLPFSRADLHAYFEQMRARGYPAVEHSPGYEAAYRPAYRVVLRSLVP